MSNLIVAETLANAILQNCGKEQEKEQVKEQGQVKEQETPIQIARKKTNKSITKLTSLLGKAKDRLLEKKVFTVLINGMKKIDDNKGMIALLETRIEDLEKWFSENAHMQFDQCYKDNQAYLMDTRKKLGEAKEKDTHKSKSTYLQDIINSNFADSDQTKLAQYGANFAKLTREKQNSTLGWNYRLRKITNESAFFLSKIKRIEQKLDAKKARLDDLDDAQQILDKFVEWFPKAHAINENVPSGLDQIIDLHLMTVENMLEMLAKCYNRHVYHVYLECENVYLIFGHANHQCSVYSGGGRCECDTDEFTIDPESPDSFLESSGYTSIYDLHRWVTENDLLIDYEAPDEPIEIEHHFMASYLSESSDSHNWPNNPNARHSHCSHFYEDNEFGYGCGCYRCVSDRKQCGEW